MSADGNVMAVDDTPENRRLLTDMLRENGFKTRAALSGAMARRLAALSGGRIWGESATGKGTCFHFTLLFEPYANET